MNKNKFSWKRIIDRMNRINPIFYGLLGFVSINLIAMQSIKEVEKGYEIMAWTASVCLLGIPTLLIFMKQTKIQSDTVKFQMFDRRYHVYKTYIDVVFSMMKQDNNFEWILNEKTTECVIARLLSLRRSLFESTVLAFTIYNKDSASELEMIRVRFEKIVHIFISTLTSDEALHDSEKLTVLELEADSFIEYIKKSKMKQYFGEYINIGDLDENGI